MFDQKLKNTEKKNQIEGCFTEGQSIVLIEDLFSSGKSSIEAAEILSNNGLTVKGIISIFNYNFDTADKNFKQANYEYISLCDYNTLLPEAIKQQYIQEEELTLLKKWRKEPSKWK